MQITTRLPLHPQADEKNIVRGEHYRFTVLTEKMIRMEYSPDGQFEDRATRMAIDRAFPPVAFQVADREEQLEIITRYLHITYDKKAFSKTGLQVRMTGNPWLRKMETWYYGDEELLKQANLAGTASTLDRANGRFYYDDSFDPEDVLGVPGEEIPLGMGLMSKMGFSFIDDSKSLIVMEDGRVCPPLADHTDVYFLCYGRDYLGCLKDFYRLSGKTPLLPRFVLGNWWSRYHKYTQEEYLALMRRFDEEKLPFAVSVFDMDWHITDVEPRFGKGWTGYTWNEQLFPDHQDMLRKLHDMGKHVSLNLHPADGVRAFEKAYPEMAAAMGIDPKSEQPVDFDVTSEKFWDAYFRYLHHPLEEEGVDFWWLDWQQGSNSRDEAYDPLWMLNHYHYLDSERDGKRPLIFSRYAGLGSHRYPAGFSGSSYITWESLDFQPYFTATASNVGYGWWSHDIGGHRNGYRDDELTTRWIQFGVFSPIMRLHSSDEVFTGKEPWKFGAEANHAICRFLRLRHRLLPYTYTMNYRFYRDDQPLVQPMYYLYPGKEEAYQVKNQYFFGSELMVSPITSKNDPDTLAGSVKTWLPEGTWTDLFTGLRYQGGRMMKLHRPLDSIPVLAQSGAIIPLQAEEDISASTKNPDALEVLVVAGQDGTFEMYEDDGESTAYEHGACVTTRFALEWSSEKTFTVCPAEGDTSLIPEERRYVLRFYGAAADAVTRVEADGEPVDAEMTWDDVRNVLRVSLPALPVEKTVRVSFAPDTALERNNVKAHAYEAINRAQILYIYKERAYKTVCNDSAICANSTLRCMPLPDSVKDMLAELLFADPE